MAELHLAPQHVNCVRAILARHLPAGAKVSVFGSRATGRGLKDYSELDLLIDCQAELPTLTLADLREALSESDLPFMVDLLERRDASDPCLRGLTDQGLVDLPLDPDELVTVGGER